MTQVGRGHRDARRRVSGWVLGGHVSATSTLLAPSLHRVYWAPSRCLGEGQGVRLFSPRRPGLSNFPERPLCGLKGNRLSQPNCTGLRGVCAYPQAPDAGTVHFEMRDFPACPVSERVQLTGRPARGTKFILAADSKLNARPGKAVTSDQIVTHEAMENAATFQPAPGSGATASPPSRARILLRYSMPAESHHTASSLATPTATRSITAHSRELSSGVVGPSIQRHAFNRNALARNPSPTGKTCTPRRVCSELRPSGLGAHGPGRFRALGAGSQGLEAGGRVPCGDGRASAHARTGQDPARDQSQGGR
jgi:hypothetical protein